MADAKFERPDFYSMHARKLLGMPETWRWIRIEAIEGQAIGGRWYTKLTGATPAGVFFKSGPRKGEINWKHRIDEHTVIIPSDEHNAFIAAWEKETGLCRDCGNTGQEEAGWSKNAGVMHRGCERCRRREAAPKPIAAP